MSDIPTNQTAYEGLYQIAEQQAGYFTAAQAKASGYSQRQLTYYVRTHRFGRIKHGVYRLRQFPSSANEDLVVAWLSVGQNAVISHESALALYELSDALPTQVHLTIPPKASRRHPGLRLHTSRLREDETTCLEGLPVTTVPRTIADVAAGGLAEELVTQAVHQAVQRGLATVESLRAAAKRRGGRARQLVERALEDTAP
jgi:predicted transcriptional regulator of viral defense system